MSAFLCFGKLCAAILAVAATGEIAMGAAEQKPARVFTDKTLVAWVSLADRGQRGGSVLTLENPGGEFDALVFGEIEPGRWMAGSDYFRRTHRQQGEWPVETAEPGELVQVAAVYRGREVRLYRNGEPYASYTLSAPPATFSSESQVLIGLRHREASDPRCFVGTVAEARLYDTALEPAQIAALRLGQPSPLPPLGWWTFEGDKPVDRSGTFPPGHLVGGARIAGGKLHLDGTGYLLVGGTPPRDRAHESWPVYHVTAWPDEGVALPYDANGCLYWKGRYHLMYIFQDRKRPHGGHCWGHLSSTDLVNWTFHPPALVPEPGDPDLGIFSGNAFINKEGVPMLCWFGIEAGVCVATALDDDLIRWRKHPNNPIIPLPKPGEPGHGVYTVWDPYLWLEGDTYYCLLGGNKLPNGKDTLYACRSRDLVQWEMLHPFYEHPDPSWTDTEEDCSCPDFFRLGDRHVLMCISHKVGARCYIGRFDREQVKFYPEQHVRMNWAGGMFFAPESLEDAQGRRIFWAWVTDPRVRPTLDGTGSGVQSLPRVLSLGEDGTARITPVAELQALRRRHRRLEKVLLKADSEVTLRGIRGDCLELAVTIDPGRAQAVGLKVRCAPSGQEETGIWYNPAAGTLSLDMARSTLREDVTYGQPPFTAYNLQRAAENKTPYSQVVAPLALPPGEPLKLRVFLDGPMLEVFANDRQCLTQQIFPARPDSLAVKACARGGMATLLEADAWEMAPAQFIDQRAVPR
ncbi:MAG: hypothetical protein GX774_12900 [Armatimonadetes bacterium]|nr:hypothetical protein [Armatimonadota bacterium]